MARRRAAQSDDRTTAQSSAAHGDLAVATTPQDLVFPTVAPDILVDGLSGVSVINGVVRMNMFTVKQTAPTEQRAILLFRLCMSLSTFPAFHDAIRALITRIAALEERLDSVSSTPIETRRIPDDEAKQEIKSLFEERHGEVLFPSDVAEELNLEYDLVVRLLTALQREGKIAHAQTDEETPGRSTGRNQEIESPETAKGSSAESLDRGRYFKCRLSIKVIGHSPGKMPSRLLSKDTQTSNLSYQLPPQSPAGAASCGSTCITSTARSRPSPAIMRPGSCAQCRGRAAGYRRYRLL